MNPYLEQDRVWHDFHERAIPVIAEQVGSQVDPHYVVRIDEHVYIKELADDRERLAGRSDVLVSKPSGGNRGGAAVLEPPALVELPAVDVERLSFVEIRDRDSWELVTVLELLSPSNKFAGPDREQYLAKRSRLLSAPVHLVEIDMLRGGPRLPFRGLPDCDYYLMVSRVEQRPRAGVWPVKLREPLPEVPVPLRAPDGDARLDLQAVLHRVYDAARYQTYIYRGQPQPRLSSEDWNWARQFVPGETPN
jgi:hypothetical protein